MLLTISKNHSFPKRELLLISAIAFKLWKSRRNLIKALIVKVSGSKRYKFDASVLLGVIDFLIKKRGVKSRRAIMSFQNLGEVTPPL
jgi:hypothetical protein